MKYKYIIFLLFLLLIFSLLSSQLYAEEFTFDLTPPSATELVEKEDKPDPGAFKFTYRYRSMLSRDEIIEYYQQLFASQGFSEKRPLANRDNIRVFNKGILNSVMLNVYRYDERKEETFYYLHVMEMKHAFTLSYFNFQKPQRLGFAPVYPRATQGQFSKAYGGTSVMYLAPGEQNEVVDFYLGGMQQYGWKLISNESREGRFNLLEMLGPVNKDPNFSPQKAKAMMPGKETTAETTTLTFERGNEKCLIFINQFKDSFVVLEKSRIIDPEPLRKYGNIIIAIDYN